MVLVALSSSVRVVVGSGENGGNAITYTNVVRAEHRLGTWNGGASAFVVSPALLHTPLADRYAVLLRQPDGGAVLAARLLPAG